MKKTLKIVFTVCATLLLGIMMVACTDVLNAENLTLTLSFEEKEYRNEDKVQFVVAMENKGGAVKVRHALADSKEEMLEVAVYNEDGTYGTGHILPLKEPKKFTLKKNDKIEKTMELSCENMPKGKYFAQAEMRLIVDGKEVVVQGEKISFSIA